MDHLAQAAHAYLLIGTVARTPRGAPLNSAALVSPEGREVIRYDKVNLVPFGEFVPWPFGFANKISTETGDFVPGKQRSCLARRPASTRHVHLLRIGVPQLRAPVRQQRRRVLFNISNDGWFGKSAAREQHLAIVRMRAAENRPLDSARHQ